MWINSSLEIFIDNKVLSEIISKVVIKSNTYFKNITNIISQFNLILASFFYYKFQHNWDTMKLAYLNLVNTAMSFCNEKAL